MATRRRPQITDADGVLGQLITVDAKVPDHPIALVELPHGARVRVPFELLEHHDDGGYTMSARWPDFVQHTDEAALIPIIEENVKVSVRPGPSTELRAHRKVVRDERVVEVPHSTERIDVQHVPIDQFVTTAPGPRQEGDTLVIPVVEEVPVVEVRLRVREELRIRVVREQTVHRETVTVRRHEIELDRTHIPQHPPSKTREGEEL